MEPILLKRRVFCCSHQPQKPSLCLGEFRIHFRVNESFPSMCTESVLLAEAESSALHRAMISDAEIVVVVKGSANEPSTVTQTGDLRKGMYKG